MKLFYSNTPMLPLRDKLKGFPATEAVDLEEFNFCSNLKLAIWRRNGIALEKLIIGVWIPHNFTWFEDRYLGTYTLYPALD